MPGLLRKPCLVMGAIGALTAGGCGGGSSHRASIGTTPEAVSPTTSAPPAASSLAGTAHRTNAQAQALAQAINLKPSDLPGFTASHHTVTASDRRTNVKLARCAGITRPDRAIADVHSDDFKSGSGLQSQEVSSEVEVVATRSLVARDLAAIRSPRARSCLAARINALVVRSARGTRVTFGGTRFTALPPSAPGSDASFGYGVTIIARASAPGARVVRIPFYIDFLGFAADTAEVSLTTSGIGQPFPAGTEQRMFALLVSRAVGSRI